MPHQLTISVSRASGIQDLVLEEIDADTAKSKHLIGTAYGMNLMHCLYLGSKYGKNFREKVKYYRNIETDERLRELRQEQPGSIGIEFYGEL